MQIRCLAALVGLPLVGACAPPPHWAEPATATPREVLSAPAPMALAVRVIVKFHAEVAYRDPLFLQGIEERIHARLVYVAGVAERVHIYQLVPEPGQHVDQVLGRLGALPLIVSAEVDHKARAN